MGLKKYEIITVGNDRRVRALRSWQVGDRYVNIGDVGGIVYDEKTLSQDGACWLFRGNFNFPGARIGGDSIVDVGEATLSAAGSPAVDILGSSVVVGSKLIFGSDQTAADAVVLTADDFEQGGYASLAVGQKPGKDDSSVNFIRIKNPIFLGGKSIVIKAPVPGYIVTVLVTDADGYIIKPYKTIVTDDYQIIPVEAGHYAYIRLTKNPAGPTVPADATAAQIAFTGTYETKLSIIDSRVEVNPANATGTAVIYPGGTYTIASGAKYPEAIIRNSKVSINSPGAASRSFRLLGQIIGSTATLDATAGGVVAAGSYSNVKNITASGVLTTNTGVSAYNIIQATDCDNFAVSPTIFPGLAAAQTANIPFIFQGCNVPNGIFYHHSQIANTYKNIDFAKASVDLGKITKSYQILVSSEAEGMYRIYSVSGSAFGALVESTDSVKSLYMATITPSYGTTIYKDAYLNGMFDFSGTNVFGNKVRSHPLAQVLNVQPRVVQGGFNTTTTPPTVIPEQTVNTVMNVPLRINGANGLKVENVPTGVRFMFAILDANLKFIQNSGWQTGEGTIAASLLQYPYAMITFNRTGGGALSPADLAGVTVTVYNGCKIVNTGETEVNMKGNIRVEDNATLVNASVTGTGYFGGNSVVYYNPAVWAALECNGTAFMNDNAVFAPTALTGSCAIVRMEGNAKFIGSADVASSSLSFIMRDNAVIEGKVNTQSGVVMSGNSRVAPTGIISASSRGVLVMKDNASIEANAIVIGAITLTGNYKQTVNKMRTGKRTITDVNEPNFDNNVKTQYDF